MAFKRKGIGLNMIGNIIIATIGVSLLVAIIYGGFGVDTDQFFCTLYQRGASIFTDQTYHPGMCRTGSEETYQEITTPEKSRFTLELAREIVNCWDEYQGYYTNEELCRGWNVQNLEEPVNESYLNQKLKENDLCPDVIQNNETEHVTGTTCGEENQIMFDVKNISKGDMVLIEYNTTFEEPPKEYIKVYR